MSAHSAYFLARDAKAKSQGQQLNNTKPAMAASTLSLASTLTGDSDTISLKKPSNEPDASSSSTKQKVKKALGSLAKAVKEHHESVNGAFEAYYGSGMRYGAASK